MKYDIFNALELKRAVSPAAATTDNTAWVSQILDLQGYGAVMLAIQLGALADADATFTVLLEHSDEVTFGGEEEAVADADLLGTEALAGFTFADDNECRKLGYKGSKRYLRATITPADNTGNAFLAAMWILGHIQDGPPANPPA